MTSRMGVVCGVIGPHVWILWGSRCAAMDVMWCWLVIAMIRMMVLDGNVRFCFSGYYHYTSAGIVVITAKTKSNIKEAKV